MRTGQTLPLYTRLLSSQRPGHRSENHEIVETMETVQRQLHTRPLWLIDRGGDRGRLWTTWLQAERAVLVRAANYTCGVLHKVLKFRTAECVVHGAERD